MDTMDFRKAGYQAVDWIADYMENIGSYPVKKNMQPGDIKKQLPKKAPQGCDPFEAIFSDFKKLIVPGMTHWQHPQFFGYFPSGSSPPSILADMLSSALGAQCMMWITSPAAEELEDRMMEWLGNMLGLPNTWSGCIQDTSSTANLVAILTARENSVSFAINQRGFDGTEKLRVYTSREAHSSVEKAVKIAGLGVDNLIRIDIDENFQMCPEKLDEQIQQDIMVGFVPLCIVSTIGTTNSTAIDPILSIGEIGEKYGCWHHIDASYAGTALMLPEMRWMSKGIELADSFVVNPHKWMLVNLDCSAYFVRDKDMLTKTFKILPNYLDTPFEHKVNDYRNWSIPLGRRFRSLKLWFVIRTYGVEGLQRMLKEHLTIGKWFQDEIDRSADFELLAPVPLNLVCFRYKPQDMTNEKELNTLNDKLALMLNQSEEIFLTKTKLKDKVALRFVSGSLNTHMEGAQKGWAVIQKHARSL